MPHGSAAPAGPFGLEIPNNAIGHLSVAKGNQNLIQDDVIQDLETGALKSLCESRRKSAVSLHHFREANSAERSQSGPYFDSSRPS